MQTPQDQTQIQVPASKAVEERAPKEPAQKTAAKKPAAQKPAPAKKATQAKATDRKGDKSQIGNGTQEQKKAPSLFPAPVTGGQVEIFLLFGAKRDKDVSVNRRRESLASMQEQLYLGSCVGRAAKVKLMEAKAAYAKTHPDYYFWISTKKALGTLPANLEMAVALENVINSFKK